MTEQTQAVANATKDIMDPNLEVFIEQIVAARAEGWQPDPTNPPMLRGFCYHTILLMPEDKVPEPKKDRKEILSDARAAKKAKKEAEAEPSQEPVEAPEASEQE